ncbi:putative transposase, mutator type, MULE transposase domain-containing protein [Helianthus annuus]|nr:putative transposase, mutator type, MULE transposase domain-containing protein [Helianthus annuus]
MAVNEMENGEVYFSSYYICFKGVKDGWINGCRKVLGLDGCFLKNSGQLLTAMGRDANNHIFPLAWAAVSVENKENWKWFLNLVRYDIEMESGLGLTLISDQHKGIIEAVKDVFPYAEHRQCVRHIYANYKKKYRGEQFINLFWKATKATTEEYFEKKMEELKNINKGAYTHLTERNSITWSKAFFELNKACDAYENGMSESFNSRILSA